MGNELLQFDSAGCRETARQRPRGPESVRRRSQGNRGRDCRPGVVYGHPVFRGAASGHLAEPPARASRSFASRRAAVRGRKYWRSSSAPATFMRNRRSFDDSRNGLAAMRVTSKPSNTWCSSAITRWPAVCATSSNSTRSPLRLRSSIATRSKFRRASFFRRCVTRTDRPSREFWCIAAGGSPDLRLVEEHARRPSVRSDLAGSGRGRAHLQRQSPAPLHDRLSFACANVHSRASERS